MSRVILYSNCIPVNGFKRSIIYDLQRSDFKYIPNSLYELIIKYSGYSLKTIKSEIISEHHKTLKGYLQFLINNEFIFSCNKNELLYYPKLNFSFELPSGIQNLIIIFSEIIREHFQKIISGIIELNVKNIFIHFNEYISIKELNDILLKFDYTRVYTIELSFTDWLPYTYDDIDKIISFKRVQQLNFIENQNVSITYNHPSIKFISHVYFNCNKSPKSVNDFFINNSFFLESLNYHTFFNKRVAIDQFGDIKNDLFLMSYGNIKDFPLNKIIENNNLKKLWYVKKDMTLICKDCEYRYMCMDSREPFLDNMNLWYHMSECNYNPYVAKWKGEEGYITVEEWSFQNLNK